MVNIVSVDILQKLRDEVLDRIHKMSFEEFHNNLDLKDYHGFGKADFTGGWVEEILSKHNLTRQDIQVDIIFLWTDLSHEIHQHKKSRAEIFILGESEHMPSPRTAEAYLNGKWSPIKAGDQISVGLSQSHGFRIPGAHDQKLTEQSDKLYFLSLQNPPIVTEEYDDYQRVVS